MNFFIRSHFDASQISIRHSRRGLTKRPFLGMNFAGGQEERYCAPISPGESHTTGSTCRPLNSPMGIDNGE
jgi:hypothetical protein